MGQMESVSVLGIGTILNNQYIIEKVLGVGGFGITYLCTDKFLKIRVAVKEFFPSQIAYRDTTNGTNTITVSSAEYEKMYRRGLKDYEYEANKLTKFSGLDGVVSVLNFFFENSTAYMVMEFIEGITLKNYLNNHSEKVSWKEMLSLMKPIFASMKKIHDAGIIHRDISPDNIMISNDRRLTIIDFGSAKNYADRENSSIMLKHGYAPPEQYYHSGNQGPWTDVYALSATMYRMVVGKRPPKSKDIRSGEKRLLSLREFDKTIPVNVDRAIQNGLEVEVENRTPSVSELEKQLYSGFSAKLSDKTEMQKMLFKFFSLISVFIIVVCLTVFELINIKTTYQIKQSNDETIVTRDTKVKKNISDKTKIEEKYNYEIPKEYIDLPMIDEKNITYEIKDDYVIIDKLDASISDGKIPDIIDGKKVNIIKGMGQNITNIMLPEGVEIIEENAFKNCVYLESIYIPSTINEIDKKAFVNCQSLKEIELSGDNENFYIKDNSLFLNNGEEVVTW